MYSLFVKDADFLLASALNYREFLNELGSVGGFHNLLRFTPDKAIAVPEHEGKYSPGWDEFSLEALKMEAQKVVDSPAMSELSKDMAMVFLEAIEEAERTDEALEIE